MKRSFDAGGHERERGRYHVEHLPAQGEVFELGVDEARHASGSRRARRGDAVTLFDGSGWDLEGRVVSVSKGAVRLRGTRRTYVGAPTAVPVVCATALPKGSREDILVGMCAQMGVSMLIPVDFERSVVKAASKWEKRRERFGRLALQAAKQSGASVVMKFGEPTSFRDFVASGREGLRLFGLPEGGAGVFAGLERGWPFEEVTYLVGPEGGLSDAEREEALSAGFKGVRLGGAVLRIETACAAFAAVVTTFSAGKAGGGRL